MSEETFTVVGTAKSPNGLLKVRWTNNMETHHDRIYKQGCRDIRFFEMPNAMNKLEALEWLIENRDLSEEEMETVFIKKAEKVRKLRKEKLKHSTI
ncbi:hypothetical protein HOB87_10500 [Candidatus Woesearchaeota archaeon]|jgi:hypothetical protein|nr:hypothetical protein [Candidatus Woesearchaeota archaeon]